MPAEPHQPLGFYTAPPEASPYLSEIGILAAVSGMCPIGMGPFFSHVLGRCFLIKLIDKNGNPAKKMERIKQLLEQGVQIPCPQAIEIDAAVKPERIASGVVIHAGSRILGEETSIGPGCEIGGETPATVENCQLGRDVSLKGGFFSGATFLDGSSMGSGAHVRPGTLLEEEASGAHAVGFKQTILMPYVTVGSLINFCDCLMAGGTSRKNHSEVGSSYIHFNFTPHQDKATASLLGDVAHGVMLDRSPIFLGGQGGLVGPVRIAFGTVIPAGVVCRQDVLREDQVAPATPPAGSAHAHDFKAGRYRAVRRIVTNNLVYLGNLFALKAWYEAVRIPRAQGDVWREACCAGALQKLDLAMDERIKRLKELAGKMPHSLELAKQDSMMVLPEPVLAQQRALMEQWPDLEEALRKGPHPEAGAVHRDAFLSEWSAVGKSVSHLEAVASLRAEAKLAGSLWLQAIVDEVAALGKGI
jgi:acetyltransferase-like isoleucine patch superfamily enzyme